MVVHSSAIAFRGRRGDGCTQLLCNREIKMFSWFLIIQIYSEICPLKNLQCFVYSAIKIFIQNMYLYRSFRKLVRRSFIHGQCLISFFSSRLVKNNLD